MGAASRPCWPAQHSAHQGPARQPHMESSDHSEHLHEDFSSSFTPGASIWPASRRAPHSADYTPKKHSTSSGTNTLHPLRTLTDHSAI
ncbi:hypothetical protein E2C01_014832 [Portunus trituberculatus]|uniref:Uncharacterized protein n=1 Tax=Portunus trituberculatus TaxID=210409 RepID=A0A5B7DJS6_PORTR|nr:hypothetical protein [Portunus trituberculatus]